MPNPDVNNVGVVGGDELEGNMTELTKFVKRENVKRDVATHHASCIDDSG